MLVGHAHIRTLSPDSLCVCGVALARNNPLRPAKADLVEVQIGQMWADLVALSRQRILLAYTSLPAGAKLYIFNRLGLFALDPISLYLIDATKPFEMHTARRARQSIRPAAAR